MGQSLNYSVEYQVRFNDNMSSLSSHFLELMKYHRVANIDPADKYCDYVLLMRYSFTWKKKMREGHRSASMKGVSKSCGSNGKDTAR